MADEPRPEDIARRTFRTVFRGFDPAEVSAFLGEVAEDLRRVIEQRDRLAARLGELGSRDLAAEFEAVSREVGRILEVAREAAEAMRERAAADAARWRSEAVAEVEAERRRARADAEHLRGDAWATAEELLKQVQKEAEALRRGAEQDAITVLGEAEREAHRIGAAARREAEELLRNARMEAERLVVEAQARHDEIIESARRQAEAAQERARALEERRDELMKELTAVRAALSQFEGELDARRETAGLSEPEPSTTVKVVRQVVPEAAETSEDWEPGETVRVIRPAVETPPPEPEVPDADELAAEVERLRRRAESEAAADVSEEPGEPEAESVEATTVEAPDVETVAEVEAPADEEPVSPVGVDVEEPATSDDEDVEPAAAPSEPAAAAPAGPPPDVEDLFARLRTAPTVPSEPTEPTETAEPSEGEEASVADVPTDGPPERTGDVVAGPDPFELRDRLLLPVTNRALRNVKRQLTEEQNVALEEIRLSDGAWDPSVDDLTDRVKADLVVLAAESFAAGYTAVCELLGEDVGRPSTPTTDVASGFAADLVHGLRVVLEEGRAAGQGSRQLGASISRVFRGWRTDEAERRVRDIAHAAFHRGVARTLEMAERPVGFVVAGRGCATCRAAAEEDPVTSVPPLHPGCACLVVPA